MSRAKRVNPSTKPGKRLTSAVAVKNVASSRALGSYWTKKSAHLVLQMRTQVLDERLEETFRDWYPDFRTKPPENEIQKAA